MVLCQYCNKNFSTKGNLLHHQKKIKYCLRIQEQRLENDKSLLITKLEYELVEKGEIIQKMKDVEVKNKILESSLVEKDEIITEKDQIIQKLKDIRIGVGRKR